MSLWPRSLLWRSVVLIALLLALSQAAWLQLFRFQEQGPHAKQIASQIASIVNLTRAALTASERSKRRDLLLDLSQQEGIRVYPAQPGEPPTRPPERPFVRLLERETRALLGRDTELELNRRGIHGLWVSFRIDGDRYWVVIPRSRIQRPFPWQWVGWGGVLLLLSVIGAYFIVSRINRPLARLALATEKIGKGELPEPVEESGPAEIRALSRSFNRMAEGLKRLETDRVLLLAGVSHDLRTPLSRLRLGVEMLHGADPALKQEMVRDIEDMDAIIGQFLAYVRQDGGEATDEDADLNAIVRTVAVRHNRAEASPELHLGKLPPLPLKPVAVQRLVGNLVENALRHAGPPVEIHTGVEGGYAVLRVLDRGPGIPEAEIPRMIQPFTRLDSARGSRGAGLGLAIVERIARLHAARLALSRRPGGGLEAKVEFPLGKGAHPPSGT